MMLLAILLILVLIALGIVGGVFDKGAADTDYVYCDMCGNGYFVGEYHFH